MVQSIKYDNSPFYYEATIVEDIVVVPAETTLKKGTILGELYANGKLTKFDKTKTTGAEVPMAFLNRELVNDTEESMDMNATVIILGKINENKLPDETKTAIKEIVSGKGKVSTILKNNGLLVLSSQELMKYLH